jgi:hypothetical protein
MEIEINKDIKISGEPFEAGSLVDVTPQIAEKLIRRGFAVSPDQKPKIKKSKGKKWQAIQESTES